MIDILKKIILTIVYPVWFLLAKTWLCGVLVLVSCVSITPLIVFSIIPEQSLSKDEVEGFAGGLSILSLLISPFIGILIMYIGSYLEEHYKLFGYKIEMEFKMP